MRTTLSVAALCVAIVAGNASAQTAAEQRAILRDFERAVAAYVDNLAALECADVRPLPNQPVIFTLPVSMVFRQLIATAFGHSDSATMSAPKRLPEPLPQVYDAFSFEASSALPPSVAAVLPVLPLRLEYRFVRFDLVLRDVDCNLVVAVLRDAIRHTTTLTQMR
jgi:hypothetical protein